MQKFESVPFTQEVIHFNQVELHLIHFENYDPAEYLEQLTEGELERYFTFTHLKRRQEFVATRILRHRLFGFEHIHYDDHGAPYINKVGYISISHAPGSVGIALSGDFKVGLDLELVREKAVLLSDKFLSEQEKHSFDQKDALEMTKVWSAKEALYKLAGRKQILFRDHLHLEKRSEDRWHGKIVNPEGILSTELAIFTHGDLIVSLNVIPCAYEK